MTVILVVDDDVAFCESIRELLTQYGFYVFTAHHSAGALQKVRCDKPNLILLDLVLPGDLDGISICRAIRAISSAPIMMLTAIGDDVERIISLEAGADYYLTKPFNARVLIAQIHALLRRCQQVDQEIINPRERCDLYEFAGWKLNLQTRMLTFQDRLFVKMTTAEYTLLRVLLEHPGKVLSRDQLLELTGRSAAVFDRSIDVLMSRLRAKIQKGPAQMKIITTVRNGGYLLSCKVSRKQESISMQKN